METNANNSNNPAVVQVQEWLNSTYGSNPNFVTVDTDGIAGNSTCKALVRAIQIELNVTPVDGVWGDGTSSAFTPLSINSNSSNASIQRQIYILQGGFYCKGIEPGGFDGVFGETTAAAIRTLESQAGLSSTTGIASAMVMKALLSTDAYTLLSGGDSKIRTIQQALNNQYNSYIGLIPCDGIFSRVTSKALIKALQVEEKKTYSTVVVDGIWGSDTMAKCPTLRRYGTVTNKQYVYILQYALYVNGYDPNGFDGGFGAGVQTAVTNFQAFVGLSADGIVGKQTWASLMVSYGDPDRTCTAADCMTPLTKEYAQLLVENGKTAVGRYIVGGSNKVLTIEELNIIKEAGLKVFPIFQRTARTAAYFTYLQGRYDAYDAYKAYRGLHFPTGGTVYFAVDFDVLTTDISDYIIPYFQGIHAELNILQENEDVVFNVGVYGPRYVCTRLNEENLATTSFVSDMSSGFSCNIGYPLPQDWAFDQIKNTWLGGRTLEIDNDVASSRDTSIFVDPDIYLETPNPVLAELQVADAVANCIGCKPNILGLDINYDVYIPFFASSALDVYLVLSHTMQSEGDLAFSLSVENGVIQNPEVQLQLDEFSAELQPIVLESVDYAGIAAAINSGFISFETSVEMVGDKVATSVQITVNIYHDEVNKLSQDLAIGIKFVIKDASSYSDALSQVNTSLSPDELEEAKSVFSQAGAAIQKLNELLFAGIAITSTVIVSAIALSMIVSALAAGLIVLSPIIFAVLTKLLEQTLRALPVA